MSEKKFTTLRKRLDQLGYRQPLVIEAVPLVEKLFSDLVHTTESFKNYRSKTSRYDKELNVSDVSEPYRNDNAKLVRENNELHLKLIKIKEENEMLLNELKSKVQKLEHENQDLRFLNTQYVHKIKNLEKESRQKSEHIQNLQEKNMNAVVETPGGRKKNIPFRRQRMDIESTLQPNMSVKRSSHTTAVDPYVADLLGIADNRIEQMKQDMQEMESDKENIEWKNASLMKKVESREKEIKRLQILLDGGRPVEAVLKDKHKSSSDKVVAHLNMQVDYLQQANRDLEKQLTKGQMESSETSTVIKNLQERNEELCMELAAMDKICKNIGKQKQRFDEEIDEEINLLKVEIEEKSQSVLDLQSSNYKLRKERDELIEESQRVNQAIKAAQDDKKNIAELYERCEKEKRRLAEKNAKLTIAERGLVMDLERLKVSKGVLPKKTQSPDQMEFLIRNLEDDRDYYKKECDTLQKIMHKRLLSENTNIQKFDKKEKGGVLELMTDERDYYKKECETLKETKKSEKGSSNDVHQLKRERDNLRKLLETFENQLTEIQENVRAVTTDKENVQMLYEQSSEEIQRLRRQISRARSPSSMSKKVTEILEKAEKERDEALHELRQARVEVQNLRNDIRLVQEKHLSEKHLQSTKGREVEDLLNKMETDKMNLTSKISSSQNIIHMLEDQLSVAKKCSSQTNAQLHEKDDELSKLRLMLEQNDRTCEELKRKLEKTSIESNNREEDNNKLEEKLEIVLKDELEYKNELIRLKTIISTIDQERDNLQQQVDDKAEKLVKLDDGLRAQEKAEDDLKFSIEELEENLRFREQELSSKEREIVSLTKQLRSLEEELAAVTRLRDVTTKENKHIQDDLALMTEENQSVHQNLQQVLDESHNLKQQIEEYALQLNRIQDILAEKEMEKDDLLLQYKTLSNKADILETNMQQSEDEAEGYKQEIQHKQQEVDYLQNRCMTMESEIEQHITSQESYESQITTLTKSLANLETQLRVCNEEKETILEDLYAVRELCVKLDQTREELTKKFAEKSSGHENLEELLKETRAETDALRNQLNKEKDVSKTLENIVAVSREKEFLERRSHEEGLLGLQKIEADLQQVSEQKKLVETENTLLRKENLGLQENVTSLRKQLTTEKFERERLKQQIRRSSESPTPDQKASDEFLVGRVREQLATTSQDVRQTFSSKQISSSRSPLASFSNVPFSPINVSISSDDNDYSK